ncbi:MAG: ergothioneine biosynthesis protein EgtB [Cyclobacteriaceae bacterium]
MLLDVGVDKLVDRFTRIRSHTESICANLAPEDYVVQPTEDVSPPKWHLAHTTWFFETFLLKEYDKSYQEFDPSFSYLFNSYYVSAGERWVRAKRGNLSRPTVARLYDYRAYVDQAMKHLLGSGELTDRLLYILEMGLNHEQQHQELLYYDIKYILGHNPILPKYAEGNVVEGKLIDQQWLNIEEGVYEIGHAGQGFCYDNELGHHKVYLMKYVISNRLVTNEEYRAFILDGGYSDASLWLSEGWDWVEEHGVRNPLYWHQKGDQFFEYNLTGVAGLALNAPVANISFYEADAFARWSGKRLPTEFEWEVACKLYAKTNGQELFSDRNAFQPCETGSVDFLGNLWEWTSSPYRPYPYYKVEHSALGEYNGKFMINQMVLRGGSYATSRDHIRSTYRNFFHPHLRWMFSGIRLADHC